MLYTDVRAFEEAGFNIKGQILWKKKFGIGGDLKGAMKRDWEPIVYMTKGSPELRPTKVWRNGKLEERMRISESEDWNFEIADADWEFQLLKKDKVKFPTQKPVELCRQVIRLASDPGQLVLDPFCGSGAISKAARLEGRQYLTIEADDDVYNRHKNLIEGA